jgi:dihydroorotase
MLMLSNVRLVDPASRTNDIRDILIAERRFIKIGQDLKLDAVLIAEAKGERLTEIDCTGLVAAPGFVDPHVHFRDPGYTYKEDIMSGAAAAAAGGFTSVICMANTNPPVDTEEGILEVMKKGRKAPIHIYTCACVTKGMNGTEAVDLKLMKESGAVGFSDDGRPVLNEALMQDVMRTARGIKMPVSLHEEDPKYITENGIDHGPAAERMGLTGAGREAEITLVARDLKLARETGATVCIQHVSAAESVELIRKAKRNGVRVWAEATPHHFSLTEDAVAEFGTLAKVNPPLRTEEDRKAIIEGLKDGTIEIIATDHAPHAKDEKDRPFKEAPSGMIGLETALSLGIMNLVRPGYLSLGQLIAKMTTGPAALYSLEAGTVKEDFPADLVLFDPERTWAYLAPKSKSTNTPWLGKTLTGKVMMTICSGEVVYKDDYEFSKRTENGGKTK